MPLKITLSILLSLALIGAGVYYYLTTYQESCWGELKHPAQKIILFDFDGTICDSMGTALDAFNTVAPKYNLVPALGQAGLEEYRHQLTQDFFEKHGVSSLKMPFVLHTMKGLMHQKMQSLHVFAGLEPVLKALKKEGYVLGILTSSPLETVLPVLQKNGIGIFDFIYHGSTLFGKDRILTKIKKQSTAHQIYYIGDEVRDIEACKKAGVPIVAVSWGYHAKELLQRFKPDYLVEKPEQLLKVFAPTAPQN